MDYLLEAIKQAIRLLMWGDPEVYQITWLSLRISLTATCLASFIGIPFGFLVATKHFWGKQTLITILNTTLALPAVGVGLFLYAFLSRRGPLGSLGLLFTPTAMILGQAVLALPIVTVFTLSAIHGIDQRVRETALTLGASEFRASWTVLVEARFGVMAAVIAAFGRVLAEVGTAIVLGGNIRGYTRVLTTAIALETSKGEFSFALALGLILLLLAFSVNFILQFLQRR